MSAWGLRVSNSGGRGVVYRVLTGLAPVHFHLTREAVADWGASVAVGITCSLEVAFSLGAGADTLACCGIEDCGFEEGVYWFPQKGA